MSNICRLTELKSGLSGKIVAINENPAIQEKLLAMGILPGRKISLIQKWPSYVFQIGYSRFTVDTELAQSITVALQ